jgi:hypothetical protein
LPYGACARAQIARFVAQLGVGARSCPPWLQRSCVRAANGDLLVDLVDLVGGAWSQLSTKSVLKVRSTVLSTKSVLKVRVEYKCRHVSSEIMCSSSLSANPFVAKIVDGKCDCIPPMVCGAFTRPRPQWIGLRCSHLHTALQRASCWKALTFEFFSLAACAISARPSNNTVLPPFPHVWTAPSVGTATLVSFGPDSHPKLCRGEHPPRRVKVPDSHPLLTQTAQRLR